MVLSKKSVYQIFTKQTDPCGTVNLLSIDHKIYNDNYRFRKKLFLSKL